jgi:hypothetical protein
MKIPASGDAPQLSRWRGRWALIGLAALFFGPLVFSWGYYSAGFTWRPEPKLSGSLIDPPVQLGSNEAALLAPGRWKLVVVGACDRSCWRTLVDLRQIWRSLPRYQDVLVRILVHPPGHALSAKQREDQPKLQEIEDTDGRLLVALAPTLQPANTAFVLIDPRGLVILRFGNDFDRRSARKDIDHLLRRFVPN